MEWTKIPTNMLIQRFSDKEILAITKYQLLWAELEEQPDEKTALRYMSRQQLAIALAFVCDIRGNVMRDVSQVQKKRTNEKMKYNKIKQLSPILPTESKQTADSLPEQIRLDKIREDNIPPVSKDTVPQRVTRFTKPTLDQIKEYNQQTGLGVDEQAFMDFYESKGWKVGNSPMKDWKAALRNWARRDKQNQPDKQYEPTENTESIDHKERAFYVDDKNFFIDDTMDCYKDALVGVSPETIEKVWKWIVENKSGTAVTAGWVIDRINQFKQEEVADPSKVINLNGVLRRVG